jgi:hypothetical protein
MNKFFKPLTLCLAFATFAVAGCEKKTPAEKIADGVKDGANNAANSVGDAARDVKTGVKNATN